MYRKFASVIIDLTKKYVPIVKIFKRPPLKRDILDLIKTKRQAWETLKQTDTESNRRNYRRIANKVRKATRQEASEKERKVAENSKINPKAFWNFVNSKRKEQPVIPDLRNSATNLTISDPIAKANLLNQQFSTVFTTERDKDESQEECQPLVAGKFEEIELTIQMVYKKLKNLNPYKSEGPDGLHPRVLKELAQEIAAPLHYIFVKSLQTGNLPDTWKQATVIPLFKKGSKSDPSNYRPISLTCITCKILESLLHDNILQYLLERSLISPAQFGFLKKRSAESQLLVATNAWRKYMDSGMQVDILYLDLRKAFDKVSQSQLLRKLQSIGVGDTILKWVLNFLKGRSQRVKLEGYLSSNETKVTSGVVQGSVLGPLLFNIYINDLPNNIDSEILLYADDTKIFRAITSFEDTEILQQDLNKIAEWMKKWSMEVNTEKSCHIRLGPKHISRHYCFEGQQIPIQEEARDLGVTIDSDMTFTKHYESIISKSSQVLGIIRRNFSLTDSTLFSILFKSLVRPMIEYGHTTTRPFFQKDSNAIEKIQRRATKFVPSLRDLSYQDRLKKLSLPSLSYRFLRGDLIEVYKICNRYYDNIPPEEIITFKNNNLRGHEFKLTEERFRRDVGRWAFSNRIVSEWNALPTDTVNSDSVNAFKNKIDNHYSDKAFDYLNFCR